MSITIRSMRYFVTALRLANITRAAEKLHVAPSAIAAAIDQIEAHFQLQLATRHRAKGIEPTRAGHDMTRRFERLLEEYDGVLAEGRDLKQGMHGELRIGYYAPVAPAFLPNILRRFLPASGDLTVRLEECNNTEAQSGLMEGRFDAILFVPDGAQPRIEYEPLLQAPAYALLSADHPLTRREDLYLSDLATEPLIALNRPMVTEYYQTMFEALGQRPDTIIQANTTEMVRSLVGAGLGCAILNMRPATDISYGGGRLVARPLRDAGRALTLAIGFNRTNPRHMVSAFVNECLHWAGSLDAARYVVTPEL